MGRTGLTSAAPPTRSSVAVEGHAYRFGGSAWLDTPVLPLAPLESPQLTMGAWVYPQSRFEAHDGVRAVLTLDDAQGHAARALAIDAGRWVAFAGSGGVLAGPPVRPFEGPSSRSCTDQARAHGRAPRRRRDDERRGVHARGPPLAPHRRARRRRHRRPRRVRDAVFVYSAPLTATELSVLRAGTPPPPPPAAGSAGYALARGRAVARAGGARRRQRTARSRRSRRSPSRSGCARALAPRAEAALVEWARARSLALVDGGVDGRARACACGSAGPTTARGRCSTGRQSLPDDAAPLVGRWAHLALSFNGTRVGLYVDGALVDATPWSVDGELAARARAAADARVLVGAARSESGAPERLLDGDIDELQFWRAAPSARSGSTSRRRRAPRPRRRRGRARRLLALRRGPRRRRRRRLARRALGAGVLRSVDAHRVAARWIVSDVALDACVYTTEDTAVTLRLNATDAQGRAMRAVVTAPPTGGLLQPATRRLSATGTYEFVLGDALGLGDEPPRARSSSSRRPPSRTARRRSRSRR